MATTTQQPQTKAIADPRAERRESIRKFFEHQRPELSKLLPKSMSIDRFYRIALTECTKNPALLDCSAESWALALQTCAAQGLYPDSGLGYMYLIPRENSKKRGDQWIKVWEVSAQRGYQGDIQLARNSGELADIYAEVVFEKDVFKVRKGLDRTIEHEPYMGEEDPGPLKATYAVAKLKSGETAWVVLTKRDVERHRESSQSYKFDTKGNSPWKKHEAAMWRKTAIHELSKWLPKSSENMELLARGDDREETPLTLAGVQAMSLPIATPRPALEDVKDRLRAEAPCAPEGVDTLTGEVIDEPPQGREPGEDDDVEEAAAIFTDTPPVSAPAPAAAPDPGACVHPLLKRPIPKGKTQVCPECLSEIKG